MSLMLTSSSLSEIGCSTFSLANFFPFSTSSLLSLSKCSRYLERGGRSQKSFTERIRNDASGDNSPVWVMPNVSAGWLLIYSPNISGLTV